MNTARIGGVVRGCLSATNLHELFRSRVITPSAPKGRNGSVRLVQELYYSASETFARGYLRKKESQRLVAESLHFSIA